MRKQLFLDLQAKILAIKNQDKEPLIKFFNLWHNQINFIEQPFDTPAVFIEFEPFNYQTIPGSKDTLINLNFNLHLVCHYYPVTHSTAPSDIQFHNLNFLDAAELLHSSLHLSRLNNSGTIIHNSTSFDYSYGDYIQSIERYTCVIGHQADPLNLPKKISMISKQ